MEQEEVWVWGAAYSLGGWTARLPLDSGTTPIAGTKLVTVPGQDPKCVSNYYIQLAKYYACKTAVLFYNIKYCTRNC